MRAKTNARVYFVALALMLVLATVMCSPDIKCESVTQPSLPPYPDGAVIHFRDSFMRENPAEGEWRNICGNWQFDSAAKPGVSANPFSLNGKSPQEALLITGEPWWRNYIFGAALRTPPIYSKFGVITCRRANDDFVFFGFSSQSGVHLSHTTGSTTNVLASRTDFAMPYQWYSLSLAVHGKTVYAHIDGRLVFEAELPYETCGPAGVFVEGTEDFGMTVDDCYALSLTGTSEEVAADARDGFDGHFRSVNISKQHYPSFFEQDPIMRKWASAEADWLPILPVEQESGAAVKPTEFAYAIPVFNEFTIEWRITEKAGLSCISVHSYNPTGSLDKNAMEVGVARVPQGYLVSTRPVNGKANETIVPFFEPSIRLHFEEQTILVTAGSKVQKIDAPWLPAKLKDGVQLTIPSETLAFMKAGNFFFYSSSIVEESFYEAPTNWLTVYGNWEIGSRWACSPQFTYLSSWDPMTSQLYSKHLYSGKMCADVWMSARMHSFRHPEYNPFQWFSVSLPDEAGDFSTGLTAAIAYPTPNEMTVFVNGKATAKAEIKEDMKPKSLHNGWLRMRIERTERDTTMKFNIVDKRPKTEQFTATVPVRADAKPRPFAVWNSLTGITICRVRISSQNIVRGAMPLSFAANQISPCGVETSVAARFKAPNEAFVAPSFDFTKGNAGWSVPGNQPALRTEPCIQMNKRVGVTLVAPFCGSRLAFESPQMSVDARIYRSLQIKFKTDVTLSFYIHAGLRTFRVLLNGRGKANPADWAIPVDAKYFRRSIDGGFSTVTINLYDMFEEYCTLEIPPIVNRLTLERLDIFSPSSLGVEEKDTKSFSVAYIGFTSSFAASELEPQKVGTVVSPSVDELWNGMSARAVVVPSDKQATLFPPYKEKPYYKDNGALYMTFENGFRGLTPVGCFEECQLWRKRIDKESHISVVKTGYHGYYGVRLLPEPISLIEYPAMTVKCRGKTDEYCLLVKSGDWYWLPLLPTSTIDLSKPSQSALPLKEQKIAPMRVFNGDLSWLMVYFPDIAALAGKSYVEEVFVCSLNTKPVDCGEEIPIASVIFYDPTRVGEFGRKGFTNTINTQLSRQDIAGLAVREVKLEKFATAVLNDKPKKRDMPTSATLKRERDLLIFDFSAPISIDEAIIEIAGQSFTGRQLQYYGSASSLALERSKVFNDDPVQTKWTAAINKGYGKKTLSTGELDLSEANPLVIQRVTLIPDDHFLFEDYERGIGVSSSRKAPAMLTGSNAYTGRFSLECVSPGGNIMSAFLMTKPYDGVRYPYLSFDYRLSNAKITLMANCEGHFKDAEFTPGTPVTTTYKDIYYYIGHGAGMTLGVFGKVPNVQTNGNWANCTVNLLDLLKANVFNGKYPISELALREADFQQKGASFAVDNLCIFGKQSKSFETRIEPLLAIAERKVQYAWRLVDASGMAVGEPAISDSEIFTVPLPDKKNLSLHIRIIVDGKPSKTEHVSRLHFTAP